MESSGPPRAAMSLSTPPAETETDIGLAERNVLSGDIRSAEHEPLPTAGRRELILRLCNLRRKIRVRGPSMLPEFAPGDELFLDPRAYRRRAPRVGDVVMARHPLAPQEIILKRVAFVDPDGRVFLCGDNPQASTDSRTLGLFPPEHILGRVTSRYLPA